MGMEPMNDTTTHAPPAPRREGTLMGSKRNRKRLVATIVAIASVAGGAVAAHAATFSQSLSLDPTIDRPSVWPSIPMTPCAGNPCAIDLYAASSNVDVKHDGVTESVPFLGFGVNTPTVSLAGGDTSTMKVPVGTTLNITLHEGALNPIDLSVPGLKAANVSPIAGGFKVIADKVGTFVFQPGKNPDAPRQIARGLVGVLIVTPLEAAVNCGNCAYADRPPANDEVIVATTDLDLAFATNSPDFAKMGMGYFGQSMNPDGSPRQVYHLVNGKSFPDTDVIDVQPGDKLLVRYVNAGVTDKSMGLLGLRQTLVARNASEYKDPQTFIAPLVGPGETADVFIDIPDVPNVQFYSLSDQGRQMNHGTSSGFGGALVFVKVWPLAAGFSPLPVENVPVGPSPAVVPAGPTQEGSTGAVSPLTPGAPDPGTAGQEGTPASSQGSPSGTSHEASPAQGTTGP